MFGRALNASSSSCFRRRSWITDAWAIVNESIAPKEYIVPRNAVRPGMSTRHDTRPANTSRLSHGVLKRGCRRRKTSGSCRCVAIEYVMRDAPITPAFVAMKRIVAARMPT